MKRLCIICLFIAILCGCAAGSGNEATASTPVPTLVTEELIGKTFDEVSDQVIIGEGLVAYGYAFGTDVFGNPIVLEWDLNDESEYIIKNAKIFSAADTDNSPESFQELKIGMTIYEVVEKVGIPVEIPVTGVFYLTFFDSEGVGHLISWTGDPICIAWL